VVEDARAEVAEVDLGRASLMSRGAVEEIVVKDVSHVGILKKVEDFVVIVGSVGIPI